MLMFKYKWLSVLFVAFSAIYLAQAVLIAPDKAVLTKYHITAGQGVALTLSVAIPYLLIWATALIGYLRLRDYTAAINDSPDGTAFTVISRGMLLLTLWLPLSALLSGLVAHYYHLHPSSTANLVRLNNYANLIILLPAFLLANQGARKLLSLVKRPSYQIPQRITLLFIGFAALYTFLTLNDSARQGPTHTVTVASYYLPDWATVLTIVIPRLVMWFLGIQAVYFIYVYTQKVKGSLYKAALRNVTRGLAGVVIATIMLRCFQSLSSQLAHLGLGLILLIVYVLLLVIGSGYVLIAKGAKKLRRLEEV